VINQDKMFRFLRFCATGVSVAAVDFSLVWILSGWLRPLIAVSVAYLTAVLCNFLLNKFWVFRCSRKDYVKQLSQYGLAVAGCWLTTVGVVKLSLSTITSNILIAKLIAGPSATIVGFVSCSWSFSPQTKKSTLSIPDLPV
jgi:putative flippase GtrA